MVPVSREPGTTGPPQSHETTTPWVDIPPHRLISLCCHSVMIRAARSEARTVCRGNNVFPFFLSIFFFFLKRRGFQNPSLLELLGSIVLHRAGRAARDALLQLHHKAGQESNESFTVPP